MPISPPTSISQGTLNDTSTSIALRSPATGSVTFIFRFTPRVYSNFYVEATKTATVENNSPYTYQLAWATDLSEMLSGIAYNLSVAARMGNETSSYASTTINNTKPFPTVTLLNNETPGFSAGTVNVLDNRIGEKIFSTGEIPYEGTWRSYPKITIRGRYSYCIIMNTSTGAFVELTGLVQNGHRRVIDVNPRSTQWGVYGGTSEENLTNRISELSERSNLRDFIFPAPNELERPLAIEAYMFHRDNNTSISVQYNTKMYGF